MSAIPCSVAADTRRHLTLVDSRIEADQRAYAVLQAELHDALLRDPTQIVSTPGFKSQAMTAAEVVLDEIAGVTGTDALHELLQIVAGVAQEDTASMAGLAALRTRASAWIVARAKDHADFHAGDLARQLIEGDGE